MNRFCRWLPAAALLGLAMATQVPARPAVAAELRLSPGDRTISMQHDGLPRRYRLHVPRGLSEGARPPVVVMLHGGGGNARVTQRGYGWDSLADSEGFLVVYPDGTGGLFGRVGLTWNAGTCCGSAWENDVDDVGFIEAVLDDLAHRTSFDAARVYAAGHSNGGMMAYRLAREASPRFAAIASVAGCSLDTLTAPTRPVPILHIHSVDDPRAPWVGGESRRTRSGSPINHGNVEASLAWWARVNGCGANPERRSLPSWRSPNGTTHTVERLAWSGGRGGSEVVLLRMTGPGHEWPGHDSILPEQMMGPKTDVIDATREAWNFLRRFRRERTGPR